VEAFGPQGQIPKYGPQDARTRNNDESSGSRIELISATTSERGLAAVAAAASAQVGHLVSQHPRSVSAADMLMLAGFGVTAFGVSSLAPDVSDLPRRLVTEIVTPNAIQSQLDALAEHELQLYRTDLTSSTDTADTLLRCASAAARSARRCSPRPTTPACPIRSRRSSPRSFRPTSTSIASCARATRSRSSTKR